jgi:hypothetical protein
VKPRPAVAMGNLKFQKDDLKTVMWFQFFALLESLGLGFAWLYFGTFVLDLGRP